MFQLLLVFLMLLSASIDFSLLMISPVVKSLIRAFGLSGLVSGVLRFFKVLINLTLPG